MILFPAVIAKVQKRGKGRFGKIHVILDIVFEASLKPMENIFELARIDCICCKPKIRLEIVCKIYYKI